MSGPRTAWSTPADIVAGVQRLWDSGALLAARLENAPCSRTSFGCASPVSPSWASSSSRCAWVATLKAGSRAEQGHGYDLIWRDINHRQLGAIASRLPQ
jgi:hypothetical protein